MGISGVKVDFFGGDGESMIRYYIHILKDAANYNDEVIFDDFGELSELDFDLKATTTEDGRRYLTPNGNSYPSVTTVLSSYNKKAILEWRQRVGEEVVNKIIQVCLNVIHFCV